MRLVLFWLVVAAGVFARPFISKWTTSVANEVISLPFDSGIVLQVDWGDGTALANYTTPPNHSYASTGTHVISVDGIVWDIWRFQPGSNMQAKLIEISQWGDFWANEALFANCSNLATISALDQPQIGMESSMARFFSGCTSLNSPLTWDLTGVSSLVGMFENAISFNSPVNFTLSSIGTDVTGMFRGASSFNSSLFLSDEYIFSADEMFLNAISFNQPILFSTFGIQSAVSMFKGATSFNHPVAFPMSDMYNAEGMFQDARSFNSMVNFTSNIQYMSRLFQGATKFNQPVQFDTSTVSHMDSMFQGASSFNQPVNFVTNDVVTTAYMFAGATAFNQPINFASCPFLVNTESMFFNATSFNSSVIIDTSWVTNMNSMFANAVIFNQPLNLQTGTVATMRSMFAGAAAFNQLVSSFATDSITDMSMMFWGATSFNQPVNFMTNLVQFMQGMFMDATSFNQPVVFSINNVKNMSQMFKRAVAFNSVVNLTGTSNSAFDMREMFAGAVLFNQPFTINTGRAVDMTGLFFGASSFNQPVNFSTGNVTVMDDMFNGATSFNQSISFSMPYVNSTARMFYNATSFNSPIPINPFRSKTFAFMFAFASSFNKQINFNNAANADLSYMFYRASAFNQMAQFDDNNPQVNLVGMFAYATSFNATLLLNSTGATSTVNMFLGASSYNQLPNLDTRAVANMSGMFAHATSFNRPLSFNTSMVQDMSDMFNGATSFNQVCSFDTTSVTTMSRMFYNATSFNSSVSLNPLAVNNFSFMFAFASNFDQQISFNHEPGADLSYMFYRASAFNQMVVFNDQTAVSSTAGMFAYATSFDDAVVVNTTGATSTANMFLGASSYNQLTNLDTRAVVNMSGMFAYATSFNQTLFLDTSMAVEMDEMFLGTDYALNSTARWQTPSALRCANFCAHCSLPAFPLCSPCSIKVSVTTGARLCQCPLTERTVSATQCGILDTNCSTCVTVVNSSGSVSVGNVSVTIPPTLFNDTLLPNVTVRIVVVPFPPNSTLEIPGGDSIVSIVIQTNGADRPGTVNLSIPVQFTIPHTTTRSVQPRQCESFAPRCVWWNDTAWVESGCTATSTSSGTQCSCNHLTDFAVLLARVSNPCADEDLSAVYSAFAVFFSLIVPYCVVVIVLLWRVDQRLKAKKGVYSAILNHALIGFVAILRLLSCLQFLNLLGDNIGARAFFVACPYLLEYVLFSRLAATWIGIVHFAMLSGDSLWVKIRPAFLGLNLLGACSVIAVFVAFCVQMSKETEIAGTVVLASFHFMFAIVFQTYACLVVRSIRKSLAASASSSGGSTLADRLEWLGRGVTFSFALQALSNIVAVSEPSQLEGWTAVFLTSNFCALCCLLAVYFAAVQRILQDKGGSSQKLDDSLKKTNSRPRLDSASRTASLKKVELN